MGDYKNDLCRVRRHWEFLVSTFGMNEASERLRAKGKDMASVKKLTHSAVRNLLRHHDREIQNNSNKDIDNERSDNNYELMSREIHPWDYYNQRKAELYCYNRENVKTMCEWVVTAPKNMLVEYQREFFEKTVEFLNNRYGTDNCVRATVHMDEAQPHMHYDFIPAVSDPKHGGFKICANDVLNRHEMRNFHPQFQKFMDEQGIPGAKVHTGVTAANGGNRTVKEMKAEREHKFSWNQYNQEHGRVREEREW